MTNKVDENKAEVPDGIRILNTIYFAIMASRQGVLRGEDPDTNAYAVLQIVVDAVTPEMLAEAIDNRGRDWADGDDDWLAYVKPEGVA